jgi:hypothetical protein
MWAEWCAVSGGDQPARGRRGGWLLVETGRAPAVRWVGCLRWVVVWLAGSGEGGECPDTGECFDEGVGPGMVAGQAQP